MDHRSDHLVLLPEGPAGEPAIAYVDVGPRASDAVVLLHSLGADHRMWAPQIEQLGTDQRVIAVDSRGHGGSPFDGPLSTDDWVDDLARLLDHAGVETASLVGLSMGGVQALAFALRHPGRTRALVLADTFAELDPATAREKVDGMSDRAQRLGMPAYADAYVAETFTSSPPLAEAALVRDAIAGMSVEAYLAAARACFGARLGDRLGDVEAPTLVLWGTRDAKTPRDLAERLAEGIPGATLRELPDAGHLANLENQAAFLAAVRDHLTAVAA